jgi:hypothetical protein
MAEGLAAMMSTPDEPKVPPLVKWMRGSSQVLCCGHNAAGSKVYWLEPSQKEVSKPAALQAIACPFVASSRDSLFGTDAQTYRYVGA